MRSANKILPLAAIGIALCAGSQLWLYGQPAETANGKATTAAGNRLEFEVVESYDAKYLGDTPGHMGRAGGLENRRPRVALGDAIFRGEDKVGTVTRLEWSRTHGSLDIEFDPVDHARVCVGDSVWMTLDDDSRPGHGKTTGAAASPR